MRPPKVLAHSWQVNSSSWEFLNQSEEGTCRDSALSAATDATDATTSCQTAIRDAIQLHNLKFQSIFVRMSVQGDLMGGSSGNGEKLS